MNGKTDEITADELVVTVAIDAAHAHDEDGGAPEEAGEAHVVDGAATEGPKDADVTSVTALDSAGQEASQSGETTISGTDTKKEEAVVPAKDSESELVVTLLDSGALESSGLQATQLDGQSTQDANGTSDKAMDTEHLPEPPASPTSNTAFSGTTSTPPTNELPAKPAAVVNKAPSANRVSISYAGGSRRLLIDAEIVDKLVVFRSEGRAEIKINVERVDDGFKGILVSTRPSFVGVLSLIHAISD